MDLKSGDPTLKELGDAIIAKDGTAPRGLTIYGYVGPTAYLDSEFNRDHLDKLVSDRPVAIFTVSGHAVILNSAALEEFGIRDGDKDPVGGRYERNQNGRLNGVLREYAALNVERRLADMTSETDADQAVFPNNISGIRKIWRYIGTRHVGGDRAGTMHELTCEGPQSHSDSHREYAGFYGKGAR